MRRTEQLLDKALYHVDVAYAFKPIDEDSDRAAIEAQIAVACAVAALVAKLEELTEYNEEGAQHALRMTAGVWPLEKF